MDVVKQVKEAAVGVFRGILHASADQDGPFRATITLQIDGEEKPLLLVGSAHRKIGDGACVAVLNPDRGLAEDLSAGSGYPAGVLKEIVTGRCDVAIGLWIEDYKARDVRLGARYRAREFKPAKFAVT